MSKGKVSRPREADKSVSQVSQAAGKNDFRRDKLHLVFKILVSMMFFNLIWYAFMNFAYGMPYPYNTFLYDPKIRFSDLSDATVMARADNPYVFPPANYFPFTWVCLRLFDSMDSSRRAFLCLAIFSGVLFLLMAKALQPVASSPGVARGFPWR